MKEKTIKDITYLLNERNLTASVIRKKEYAGDIIIPKTVVDSNMSYRVTRIGDSAFEGCSFLTAITFKGTIEQWKKIMLYSQNWEPTCVIHCTDGDIS